MNGGMIVGEVVSIDYTTVNLSCHHVRIVQHSRSGNYLQTMVNLKDILLSLKVQTRHTIRHSG